MSDYGSYAQLAAALLGDMAAGKSEEEAKALIQRSMDEYGKIDLPSLKELAAQEMGPSAMEGVRANPELAGLERDSLDELLRVGRSGGHTLEDDANLNAMRGKQARTTAAGQNRIREQMAARGQHGGGTELAMQLQSGQDSAQRASDEGLRLNADRERRALDSILAAGNQAGSMRRQDFSEQERRANAADTRSRYNADARDRAQRYNIGIPQQQFGNRLAIASGKAGQGANMVGFLGNQAAGQRAQARGYGQVAANMPGGQQRPKYDSSGSNYDSEPDEWENPYGGY